MPQYTQPADNLTWTNNSATQVAAPTSAQRATGFSQGQRPTFQLLNYLFSTTGAWIRYLAQGINAVLVGSQAEPHYRLLGGGQFSWNASTGVLAWSEPLFISMPSLADTANMVASGSVTLGPGQIAYTQSNAPFTANGDITSGSKTIQNLTYESGIILGCSVSGNGIPANTTVVSISGLDSSITISAPATATASQTSLVFATSGALSVLPADITSFAPSSNTVVLARCVAATPNFVYVGINSGQMLLRDQEVKRLLSDGYAVTTRTTTGMAINGGTAVYLSQGSTDSVTYYRNAGAGNPITLYGDSALQNAVPTGINVGDVLSGAGVTSGTTITSINGSSITASSSIQAVSAANNPYNSVPIAVTRNAGLIYLADTTAGAPAQRAQSMGLAATTTALGSSCTVIISGKVAVYNNLIAGYVYYVAPNATGTLTLTAPSAANQTIAPVGVATSATTLLLTGSASQTQITPQTYAYKHEIDMGYVWNTNTPSGLLPTVEAIVLNVAGSQSSIINRRVICTHPGSVVGLAVHFANTVNTTTTIYLGKTTGTFVSFVVPANTTDSYVTFTKGTYPIAAGDPLNGFVAFTATGQNVAVRVYATLEYTP